MFSFFPWIKFLTSPLAFNVAAEQCKKSRHTFKNTDIYMVIKQICVLFSKENPREKLTNM